MHANPTITAVKQLPRSGVHTGVISRVRVRQNRPTQCQNHLSQVHGIAICWTMCQGKGRLKCSHTQQKLPRYQPTTSCSCAARMSTQHWDSLPHMVVLFAQRLTCILPPHRQHGPAAGSNAAAWSTDAGGQVGQKHRTTASCRLYQQAVAAGRSKSNNCADMATQNKQLWLIHTSGLCPVHVTPPPTANQCVN